VKLKICDSEICISYVQHYNNVNENLRKEVCHSRNVCNTTAKVKGELKVTLDKIQCKEVSFIGWDCVHFLAAIQQHTYEDNKHNICIQLAL